MYPTLTASLLFSPYEGCLPASLVHHSLSLNPIQHSALEPQILELKDLMIFLLKSPSSLKSSQATHTPHRNFNNGLLN